MAGLDIVMVDADDYEQDDHNARRRVDLAKALSKVVALEYEQGYYDHAIRNAQHAMEVIVGN